MLIKVTWRFVAHKRTNFDDFLSHPYKLDNFCTLCTAHRTNRTFFYADIVCKILWYNVSVKSVVNAFHLSAF